jgi:Chalcone isomerase-like
MGEMATRRPHGGLLFMLMGWVVAALMTWVSAAGAAELEGIAFADTYQSGSTTLRLHGVGLARFLRTIKVYVAALYVSAGTMADHVLDDVPKRLELSYFRSLDGTDIARAAEKNLADNIAVTTIAALRPRIDRMHRAYENVKPNDRYALTYLPGIGTELALNGQPKVVIEGADFAAAYFSIWLGPDPINQILKEGLLTKR